MNKGIRSARARAQAKQQARLDKLNFGITLGDGTITRKGQTYPAPARATVSTVDRHGLTATRVALLGVFSLALKKNKGKVFLTVEGEEWSFVVTADQKLVEQAHGLAARINALQATGRAQ